MIGATGMQDDEFTAALAPYRRVRASEQLRAAVTRPSAPAASAGHRSRIVIGGVAAALVAAVVISVLTIDRRDTVDEARSRPLDLGDAKTVVFSDGTTVRSEEFFDPANFDRLRAVFAENGAEFVIVERPVASEADGRVFMVTYPPGMAIGPGPIHLEAGQRVEVVVGRGDPAAGTAGLTLYEVFPEIEGTVDRDDPAATARGLGQLGFGVRWVLVDAPGRSRDVESPPAGTVVVSVLGPNGEWTDVDPTTDTLTVEIATAAVAEQLGH